MKRFSALALGVLSLTFTAQTSSAALELPCEPPRILIVSFNQYFCQGPNDFKIEATNFSIIFIDDETKPIKISEEVAEQINKLRK